MSDLKQSSEETNTTPESLRILEAVIFASDDVISTAKLKTILPDEPDARIIRKMVDEINIQLQRERHPFEIVELGGGYQFRTIAYYQPWVQQLFKEKSSKKVSIQGLECLAIIAYRQPISKSEIELIRGVLSEGAMKTLLEKRLITITGRSDKAGRPLLYGTTPEFLKYFGINKLSDLPKIEEFEALAKEKMEEFTDEELEEIGIPMEIDLEPKADGESGEDGGSVESEEEIKSEETTSEVEAEEKECENTAEEEKKITDNIEGEVSP